MIKSNHINFPLANKIDLDLRRAVWSGPALSLTDNSNTIEITEAIYKKATREHMQKRLYGLELPDNSIVNRY